MNEFLQYISSQTREEFQSVRALSISCAAGSFAVLFGALNDSEMIKIIQQKIGSSQFPQGLLILAFWLFGVGLLLFAVTRTSRTIAFREKVFSEVLKTIGSGVQLHIGQFSRTIVEMEQKTLRAIRTLRQALLWSLVFLAIASLIELLLATKVVSLSKNDEQQLNVSAPEARTLNHQ